MSDLLKAVILGIIQGLTEFLPISSTGHLVITEKVLGVSQDEFGLRFDAAIHLGTLAAVLVYFRAMLVGLLFAWIDSVRARNWRLTDQSRLAWLLILGTIPAALAGIALESKAEHAFRSPALVGAMLILFSLPMYLAERYGRGERDVTQTTPRDALVMGVAQSIALVPGVSRSGITISAGMLSGFKRHEAAVFAFLLSAPIIAAAGGKQLFDVVRGEEAGTTLDNEYAVYAAGLVSAGIVGYAAVAFLLRFLRFNKLYVFIVYRLVVGALILALVAAGVL